MNSRTIFRALAPSLAVIAVAATAAHAETARESAQNTILISRAHDGGVPNGASTNAVISGDRRWARAIAFQSEASNIVVSDTNGVGDVLVVRRGGVCANAGTQGFAPPAVLVSRGLGGAPANGPSWGPAVDGAFRARPKCVAFV